MIFYILCFVLFMLSFVILNEIYAEKYKNNDLNIEFTYPTEWTITKTSSSYIQINNNNNSSFVGIEITPLSKTNYSLQELSYIYILNLNDENEILEFKHINSSSGLGQNESYLLVSTRNFDQVMLGIWTILNNNMYFVGYFSDNKDQFIHDVADVVNIIESFRLL